MQIDLQADILTASQPLRVPGAGEQRILVAGAAERLADSGALPVWQVEAAALDLEVVPLRYLRNLSDFGTAGQARLVRSCVALLGAGPVLEQAAELLGTAGLGRIQVLSPEGCEAAARAVAAAARAGNPACEAATGRLELMAGNPSATLRGLDAVATCLESSLQEQLAQFACKVAEVPLVVAGAAGSRGQVTTVLPGDLGVGLVYRLDEPRLEKERVGAAVGRQMALVVGAWIADQVTSVLLERDDILRGRLLYADMDAGERVEYPLGGSAP
jgi:molybdopterin/thiamine biosynthesis adenylyltransferase